MIFNYASRMQGVDFDFLCYEEPLNHFRLFENSNNRYFVIPVKIQHPIKNAIALKKFMCEHKNEYDALWFNVNEISNIDLLIHAKRQGIKRRIVHMHNSNIPNKLITKVFSKLNQDRCLKLATDYWACSIGAGKYLYGTKEFRIIPNVVDALSVSFSLNKREKIRHQYAIDAEYVIGTIGRLTEQKNPMFLIDLLPEILKKQPKAKMLLVGDGDMRAMLEKRAVELGVSDFVVFAGLQ